ncbi:amidohydrolase [Streptomyces sp. NPDC015661]|uniref:amidohydrolase n=1 Tax=Streptomyces sp. NPDC015661 TaxID=3364961 RepID=UPI0036F6F6E2
MRTRTQEPSDQPDADLILLGCVITMNRAQPEAEALAVRSGRITAVGSRDEVLGTQAGPDTRIVDYGDAAVLPGFVEAHGHFVQDAVMSAPPFVGIRPSEAPDAEAVIEIITRTVAERGAQGAVFVGWDRMSRPGLPEPTLAWMDGMSPDHPMALLHTSSHTVWFNSAAAALAGIGDDTPDPVGGHFGRTADGRLDGSAEEEPAVLAIVAPIFLPLLPEHLPAALRAGAGRANRAGVTAMSEMGMFPFLLQPLMDVADAGALSLRVRCYEPARPDTHSTVSPFHGNDMVRQIGIKLWADGSALVGTIATTFAYCDTHELHELGLPAGRTVPPTYDAEQIREITEGYLDQGWQIACHAIGDAAIDVVLDAWDQALRRPGVRADHRLRIEHASSMRPDQFRRAAALGVTVSLFPTSLHFWGDSMADHLFGRDVVDRWMAARTAVDAGIRISLHNDTPVTPLEPLRSVGMAVTRRTAESGRTLGADLALTPDEALRAVTIDAAWQLFAEDVIGSLEVGKYADVAVLQADPRTVDPEKIADLAVLATYLEGRRVHAVSDAASRPQS